MSTRLQVVFEDDELDELRATAERHGMTLSAWVRAVLREAQRHDPRRDPAHKLDAIRAAAGHELPTADIDEMLQQTMRGYLSSDLE